jgi:predicted RNA-binding protein with PUA-like domain
MAKGHWLVKSDPPTYSFADLVRDGTTCWDHVRNFQARNNLRAMRVGDLVLVYHSVDEKRVVGTASVARAAYPDPSAGPDEGDWSAVDLRAGEAFASPVPLGVIKADPALADILLVRHTRLSVMPLPPAAYARIVELGRGAPPLSPPGSGAGGRRSG